jgi:hypothetical protein
MPHMIDSSCSCKKGAHNLVCDALACSCSCTYLILFSNYQLVPLYTVTYITTGPAVCVQKVHLTLYIDLPSTVVLDRQ